MWLFTPRNAFRGGAGVVVAISFLAIRFVRLTQLTMLVLVCGLVVYGLVWFVSERASKRAGLEAKEFARTNTWTYEEQRSGLFAALRTPPFDVATATYTHVISGQFGGYECFDGVYEWRRRIDRDKYISGRHRVAAVRLPDELPRLLLVPEGFTSRIAKVFGGMDMEFESSTFNRSWRVMGDDPKVASEMLSPRVIAKLEKIAFKAPLLFERGWGVRIDSDSEGVDSLAERLGGILAVARFLPAHTIEDHGRVANSIGPLPSVATPGAMIHGYNPELQEADLEHLRTAKPRKQQKWIDAARSGASPTLPPQSGA